MKVSKLDCPHTIKIILKEGDNAFTLEHNTYHLTWTIDNPRVALDYDKEFTLGIDIPKDNEEIYQTFDRLYSSAKLLNSFKPRHGQEVEMEYYTLFNPEEEKMVIVSDETDSEVADYVEVMKKEDSFRIDFHTKVPRNGYESDLCSSEHIPVKINFEGSRYEPFDFLFRDHFRKLLRVVDKQKEEQHQEIIKEIDTKKKVLKPNTKTE